MPARPATSRRLRFTDAGGRQAPIARVVAHDGRPDRDTSVAGCPPVQIPTSRLAVGDHRLHVGWFHRVPLVGLRPIASRSVPITCTAP